MRVRKFIQMCEVEELLGISRSSIINLMVDVRIPKNKRIPINFNVGDRLINPRMPYFWKRDQFLRWYEKHWKQNNN